MHPDIVAEHWRMHEQAQITRELAPDDQMAWPGLEHYLAVGRSGVSAVLGALGLSPTERIERFLDLPCGHGRVARHLVAAFPGAEGFFCDLDKSGVEYCSRTFGGTGIVSRPELTDATLPRDLDLIWVGSLFTHVDEDRTARWLAFLAQHLRHGGTLVATFHGLWSTRTQQTHPMIDDASWVKIEDGFSRSGYGYSAYAEYDVGDYGISLVVPARIISMATAIDGIRVASYTERGWADNHDVLALSRVDRFEPWG
jgi:SAM-dependent methyltransferase